MEHKIQLDLFANVTIEHVIASAQEPDGDVKDIMLSKQLILKTTINAAGIVKQEFIVKYSFQQLDNIVHFHSLSKAIDSYNKK